jgi:hypothetical protein
MSSTQIVSNNANDLDTTKYDETSHTESSIFVQKMKDDFSLNGETEKFDQIELSIEKERIFNREQVNDRNITKTNFRRIGNLNLFFCDKEGSPKFVIGPHWPFFVCLTTTITLICGSFFYLLADNLNPAVWLIGLLVYFTQIGSYSFVFLKNPGIPTEILKRNKRSIPETLEKGFKYCDACNIVIKNDQEISHCDDCNICILGYDHHCPWTSKCIGQGNLKEFYVFITSTMLLFGYLIYAVSMINIG